MKNRHFRHLSVFLCSLIIAAGIAGCAQPAAPAQEPAQQEAQASPEEGTGEETGEAGAEESGGEAESGREAEGGEEEGQESGRTEEAAGEEGAGEEAAGEAGSEEEGKTEETKEEGGDASSSEEKEEADENPFFSSGNGVSGGSRRVLPDDTEPVVTEEKKEEPVYPSVDEIKTPEKITGGSVMFVPNEKIGDSKVTKRKDSSFPSGRQSVERLLGDLASYWDNYDLDAVDYLIRMEKYQYMSGLLDGSSDYFYVGEENKDGLPHGKGIACYAGNQYYYGDFKDGKREGGGFWYQIFIQDGPYSKANNGIYGHSYQGQWANDLPFGEGQEHLDIDTAYLSGRIVTNVIGSFINGYYSGEMTVITMDPENGEIGWRGEAINGTWVPIRSGISEDSKKKKQIPVLVNVENDTNYFWMLKDENYGQGITGLIP